MVDISKLVEVNDLLWMEGPVLTHCITKNDGRNWIIKWNHETTNDYVLYDFDIQTMQKYIDGKIDMYQLLEKSTEIYVLDIDASKKGHEKYSIRIPITKGLWPKYFKNSFINNLTMKGVMEKLTTSIVEQKIKDLLKK